MKKTVFIVEVESKYEIEAETLQSNIYNRFPTSVESVNVKVVGSGQVVMSRPDFCTTVSPDEYDCIGQWEQAVKGANKFHKRIHKDLPPPYYNFDYGKLYGLIKFYAEHTHGEVTPPIE